MGNQVLKLGSKKPITPFTQPTPNPDQLTKLDKKMTTTTHIPTLPAVQSPWKSVEEIRSELPQILERFLEEAKMSLSADKAEHPKLALKVSPGMGKTTTVCRQRLWVQIG